METLLQWFFRLVFGVIFAKVALSFVMPLAGRNAHPMLVEFNYLIARITEPIFAPIRRYTTFKGFDFSPMVIIMILIVIQGALEG